MSQLTAEVSITGFALLKIQINVLTTCSEMTCNVSWGDVLPVTSSFPWQPPALRRSRTSPVGITRQDTTHGFRRNRNSKNKKAIWDVCETHQRFSVRLSTDVSFLGLLNKVQSSIHAPVVPQLHLTLDGGVPVVLHSIVGPDRRRWRGLDGGKKGWLVSTVMTNRRFILMCFFK